MINAKLLFGVAALCAAFSWNAEAKMFKWVDANGTTHYGETIPPEYSNRDTYEIDKGHIEKREDKRDEFKKNAPLKDPAAEKARKLAERHDNALLNSYSSEQEIDLACDRNSQQVKARTDSFSMLLKAAQENMQSLQQEFDLRTKRGREIPQSLKDDLLDAKNRIVKTQADLDASTKELEDVKARYATDKVRYRELKGLAPDTTKNQTAPAKK